jgi:Zn-dependent protease
MNSGFTLFRFAGAEVRIHWSWIFVLALVTVTFGEGLAAQPSGLDAVWSWAAGVAIAALVLFSVIVHELGHVVVARRYGLGSNAVVIQLLGGAFLMELRPRTPGQELRVAAAGSLASLALMTVFGALAAGLEVGWGSASDVPDAVAATGFVTEVLAVFNVFVAIVNLIPAYPLDGARIVHAAAWSRSGQEDAATRVASRVGRLVGYAVLITGGVVAAMWGLLAGVLLAIAGWLLVGSSRMLDRRLVLRELIGAARVSDATDQDVPRLPPQLTLDVFASEYLGERFGAAALVERGEELLGIIGTAQIRRVPQRRWAAVRVEDAMVPVAAVPRAAGDSDLWPALEALERSGLDGLLVAAGERISALVTRRSVARFVRQRVELQAHVTQATLQGRVPWARGQRWQGPVEPPRSGQGADEDGAGGTGGAGGDGSTGNGGDGSGEDGER